LIKSGELLRRVDDNSLPNYTVELEKLVSLQVVSGFRVFLGYFLCQLFVFFQFIWFKSHEIWIVFIPRQELAFNCFLQRKLIHRFLKKVWNLTLPLLTLNHPLTSSNAPPLTSFNDPLQQGGKCVGSIPLTCGGMNAKDNASCLFISGCSWDATNQNCEGIHTEGSCGSGGVFGSPHINESFCKLIGCVWTDFVGAGGTASSTLNDEQDWSVVKNTIGIMTGFRADIGFPPAFQFIFSFIFFWIPFFITVWAVYMALPWVH